MMDTFPIIEQLVETPPYSLTKEDKEKLLLKQTKILNKHHYQRSAQYRNIVDSVFGNSSIESPQSLEDIPFFPVSLFKTQKLVSVDDDKVIKVLTSSGTTGQSVSRVYLDRYTAMLQAKVLVKTAQHYLGKERLPMVVLDHKSVIKNRQSYSARGAGILGMAQFGHRPFYALNDDMTLDVEGLKKYLDAAKSQKIFFFGFTFMVWQHFIRVLESSGVKLDLPEGILVHSGGWKKLIDQRVSPEEFSRRLEGVTGIGNCINFYGMVEQVGSVFFENSLHYLHASNFSHVIIRDPMTLEPLPKGQVGLIQVISMLPVSYPGHSILTEDLGVIQGHDNHLAGQNGQYFEVKGRIPKAELRGCSDTFESR